MQPQATFGIKAARGAVRMRESGSLPRRTTRRGTRHHFESESESRPGVKYKAWIDTETGEMFCECPSWFYRKNGCKHLLNELRKLESEDSR